MDKAKRGQAFAVGLAFVMLAALIVYRLPAHALVKQAGEDYPARVLLVSSVISNAGCLVDAAKPGVIVVKYDAQSDTLDDVLIRLRTALDGSRPASLAIAAHDYGEARFFLTGSQIVSVGSILSSSGQRAFWTQLGGIIEEGGRIDLLACDLAAGDMGGILLCALSEVAGVDFAASVDGTGNAVWGGDWILEAGGIDAAALYFDRRRLARFPGLLASQLKQLTASGTAWDARADDRFGWSVDIHDDYAIVGAPYVDTGTTDPDDINLGAAYIFKRGSGGVNQWGQIQRLQPGDIDHHDYFGKAVAIDGNAGVAVVGVPSIGAGYANTGGVVYIYYKNEGGADNWGYKLKLGAHGPGVDKYGEAVDVEGDYLVVGARNDGDYGKAYIYERNWRFADSWGLRKECSETPAGSSPDFGYSVGVSGTTVIVGCPNEKYGGYSESGAVYFYERDQGGSDNWGLRAHRCSSALVAYNYLGFSVAISGDYAIAGAYGYSSGQGAAYIFYRHQGGANLWNQQKMLTAFDPVNGNRFGQYVAIGDDWAAASCPEDDVGAVNTGSVYIFSRNYGGANNWGFAKKVCSADAKAGDKFGGTVNGHGGVSINGGYLIVGVPLDTVGPDLNQGSAYVFSLNVKRMVADTWQYTGTAAADRAVWRPYNGRWYVSGSSSSPKLGRIGDIPAPGDYDGDGTTDLCVWRPSNGKWYRLSLPPVKLGRAGDIPVPGNYSGGGGSATEMAVWRPGNGKWYISGSPAVKLGRAGDIPVPGDYDGDGLDELAVWRPGNGRWYIYGGAATKLGRAGDVPIPGNYSGGAAFELAVWRPDNGRWYVAGLTTVNLGQKGDVPVSGDFDNDGHCEYAVWRPSNGRWYVIGSPVVKLGKSGDVPLIRGK